MIAAALRAALRQAGDRARAALEQLREERVAVQGKILRAFAAQLADLLRTLAGPQGRVTPAAIPQIRDFVDGRLALLRETWQAQMDDAQLQAATLGASVPGAAGARALAETGVAGADPEVVRRVLAALRRFLAADGLKLSDRIWRLDRLAREQLIQAIENAIVRGDSAQQAALDYQRRAQPVPPSVANEAALAQPDAVAARATTALIGAADDSTLFKLERLFRTEINRAYTEAFVASLASVPGAQQVKFNLSPLHPRTDVCDLYARANLYGLGPGVYPLGEHPYPAHPQTLSYLTAVFTDEITDADRAGQQTWEDWLAAQPADVHEAVLGGQRKAAAFRSGQLDSGDLRLPWYQIEARLVGA